MVTLFIFYVNNVFYNYMVYNLLFFYTHVLYYFVILLNIRLFFGIIAMLLTCFKGGVTDIFSYKK